MNKFDKLENCLDRKNKRIKILFDKYKNVFHLLCLIIILLVLWLLIQFYKYRFFKFIFWDRQGNFQWVGVTALIAIISLTVTAWDNRRKFKADLISRSRIDWIENVRRVYIDYYRSCYTYWEHQLEMGVVRNEDLQEEKGDIMKNAELLKLYFGPDDYSSDSKKDVFDFNFFQKIKESPDIYDYYGIEEKKENDKNIKNAESKNKVIINRLKKLKSNKGKNMLIVELVSKLTKLVLYSGYGMGEAAEKKLTISVEMLEHLSSIMSIYLKNEWERAKKGE